MLVACLFELSGQAFRLAACPVHFPIRPILDLPGIALLLEPRVFSLLAAVVQLRLERYQLLPSLVAFMLQPLVMAAQVIDLRAALLQQLFQVSQARLGRQTCTIRFHDLLARLGHVQPGLRFESRQRFALFLQHLPLPLERLFGNAPCQLDCLLPNSDEGLGHVRGQPRQTRFAT